MYMSVREKYAWFIMIFNHTNIRQGLPYRNYLKNYRLK